MRVTPFNLIYNDIVGLNVRIAGCRDPTQIGVEGKVVDETANTLVISTGLGDKTIPKRYSKFGFYIPQEVMVDGSEIAFSPEERLKRLQRRRL